MFVGKEKEICSKNIVGKVMIFMISTEIIIYFVIVSSTDRTNCRYDNV